MLGNCPLLLWPKSTAGRYLPSSGSVEGFSVQGFKAPESLGFRVILEQVSGVAGATLHVRYQIGMALARSIVDYMHLSCHRSVRSLSPL